MKQQTPDPFGNDEQFKAYIKSQNRKQLFVVIAIVVIMIIMGVAFLT